MTDSRAPRFELPRFELPRFELPRFDVPVIDGERLAGLLRDTVYVAIGAGVLTVQQLQVRRRELAQRLGANPVVQQFGLDTEQLEDVVKGVEARLAALDERIAAVEAKYDARIEALLAKLEGRVPEQAGVALEQVHSIAKATRKQVRGLIRSAA